jgi:hypothetical protein
MFEQCFYILHYLGSFDISYIIFKKIPKKSSNKKFK